MAVPKFLKACFCIFSGQKQTRKAQRPCGIKVERFGFTGKVLSEFRQAGKECDVNKERDATETTTGALTYKEENMGQSETTLLLYRRHEVTLGSD